jgi:hypothetical protein
VGLHALQLGCKAGGKERRVGKAAETGEAGKSLGVRRQGLRLLVGDHLQPVLDGTQEAIGLVEVVPHLRLDPAGIRQPLQRHQRLGHAQRRLPAAGDQLLRLGEELDLANAAAPDLDIVPRHSNLSEAAHGMDLPLHGVDVGDGREVEVFAPDEGSEILQQAFPRGDVAGHGTRLDEGGALPVLADGFVVVKGGVGGDGKRRGARIGPQAQIGAEHVAVLGALADEAHEVARQAHQEGLHLQAGPHAYAVRIVEDDEIDVGGIVELEGAVLAHGQHDVAVGPRRRPVALLVRQPKEEAYRGRHGGIGCLRETACRCHDRPDAAQVAERDQ